MSIEITPAQQELLERAMQGLKASEEHQQLPQRLREAAEAHPPYYLYRIKTTGRRGRLSGLGETPDGRITFEVSCHLKYNPGWDVPKGHLVFGLEADDIEPVGILWSVVDRMHEVYPPPAVEEPAGGDVHGPAEGDCYR